MEIWSLSLSVQIDISQVSAANEWDIEIEHEKINFLSPSSHVLFYLLYKFRSIISKGEYSKGHIRTHVFDTISEYVFWYDISQWPKSLTHCSLYNILCCQTITPKYIWTSCFKWYVKICIIPTFYFCNQLHWYSITLYIFNNIGYFFNNWYWVILCLRHLLFTTF